MALGAVWVFSGNVCTGGRVSNSPEHQNSGWMRQNKLSFSFLLRHLWFFSPCNLRIASLVFFSPSELRARFGGLPYPPACQRLLALPPSLRHVSVQLCVLPAFALQHEGKHGNLWGSSKSKETPSKVFRTDFETKCWLISLYFCVTLSVKPMLEHVRIHPELVTGTKDHELDPTRSVSVGPA